MSFNKITLPEGFIYLDTLCSSLKGDLRYLTPYNFTGSKVPGYHNHRIIMTRSAAQALCQAQAFFETQGYSLFIYDAYRPQEAVDFFVQWGQEPDDFRIKELFYPRLTKEILFEGYIAARSGHSRGSTIDLTLIPLGVSPTLPYKEKARTLEDGLVFTFLDDGTLDMGTHLDFFDEASHPNSSLVASEYQQRRLLLQKGMIEAGFLPFSTEWWHFTLKDEPFPDIYFNFPVQ